MLLDSNSNADAMAWVVVKQLFHSYIGAPLPVFTASIVTVFCFLGMALLSVISDLELSRGSWVLYTSIFFDQTAK